MISPWLLRYLLPHNAAPHSADPVSGGGLTIARSNQPPAHGVSPVTHVRIGLPSTVMPYKRSSRVPTKRRTYAARTTSTKRVKTIVKKALSNAHVIRCQQFSICDAAAASATGAVIANPAGYTVMNGVPVGNNMESRTGPKIQEVSLHIKGFILLGALPGLFSDCLRIAVVRDHDGQGVAPAYGDVFNINAVAMAGSSNESTFPNFANGKRFTILQDVCIPIMNQITDQRTHIPIDIFCPLRKVLNYSADMNRLQDGGLRDGPIYLFQCSSSATAALTFTLNGNFVFRQL